MSVEVQINKDTLKKALKKVLRSYSNSLLGGNADIVMYYGNTNMFSADNSYTESIRIEEFAERLAKELNGGSQR
jgi:hypothetical protein